MIKLEDANSVTLSEVLKAIEDTPEEKLASFKSYLLGLWNYTSKSLISKIGTGAKSWLDFTDDEREIYDTVEELGDFSVVITSDGDVRIAGINTDFLVGASFTIKLTRNNANAEEKALKNAAEQDDFEMFFSKMSSLLLSRFKSAVTKQTKYIYLDDEEEAFTNKTLYADLTSRIIGVDAVNPRYLAANTLNNLMRSSEHKNTTFPEKIAEYNHLLHDNYEVCFEMIKLTSNKYFLRDYRASKVYSRLDYVFDGDVLAKAAQNSPVTESSASVILQYSDGNTIIDAMKNGTEIDIDGLNTTNKNIFLSRYFTEINPVKN